MLLAIAVLFMVGWIAYSWMEEQEFHMKVIDMLVAMIVTTTVVGALDIGLTNLIPPKYDSIAPTYPIYSLDTSSLSEGHFTLGSGTVQDTQYYFYYEKDRNGGYHLNKSKVDVTTIYETSKFEPMIIKYRLHWTTGLWSLTYSRADYDTKVDIYVPEGSIVQRYTPNVN